jgi:cytochrome P450
MSATSFGGSSNSVRSNDNQLKALFMRHMKEVAVYASLGILKWLQFFPRHTEVEMDNVTNEIINKRRSMKGEVRRDLLQILLDTHETNPESFSEKHLKDEMRLFM